jgi:co-chaperonin GroES (HSP10)
MAQNINAIKVKKLKPVGNRVLVSDMHFGEQTTESGLIISNDNGKERGIYPRWGRVYAKGPQNKGPYNIGDWILIEHGRWTRGLDIEIDDNKVEVRMVETESILCWANEKPEGYSMGTTTENGNSIDIRPEDFGAGR